jgi:hypothetical protein
MSWSRARRARVVAAAGITAAALLATSQAALAALTSWSVVASPDAGALHNDLHAVSGVSGTVFAVGEAFNGTSDRTLIVRESGTTWTVVTSPNAGTSHNTLSGVSVLSTSHAWAVGTSYSSRTKADRTLVLRWNGSSWKVQPSPNVGTHHNELDAVAAASATNVWAVGTYFNGKNDRTLIEHYNGVRWSVMPSPNVGTHHNALDAVTIVPRTRGAQAWAAGAEYNGTNDQTLVERLRNGRWSVVRSANVGTEANMLTGIVATSPTSAYAAGSYTKGHLGSTVHTSKTLAEHWNGTAWKAMTTDNVGTFNNEFLAIFATSPSSVYAVGRYFTGTIDQTLVQHWNGVAWHVSTSADSSATLHNEFEGATAIPKGAPIAVGTAFSGTADRTLVETCKSCT